MTIIERLKKKYKWGDFKKVRLFKNWLILFVKALPSSLYLIQCIYLTNSCKCAVQIATRW